MWLTDLCCVVNNELRKAVGLLLSCGIPLHILMILSMTLLKCRGILFQQRTFTKQELQDPVISLREMPPVG